MAKLESVSTASRYYLVESLARGGMGQVDLVMRQEGSFQRLYALKRLRRAYADDPEFRRMFIEEARIAGLIRHPNVVSMLDVGNSDDGPYLLMEYVEGLSVADLIAHVNKERLLLPVSVCADIVRQVALGLHAAHEQRDYSGRALELVHRDVSPQNVLISFSGVAKIADFGIAKAADKTFRTSTGLLKGKAGYMSPEQLQFEKPDRRSDLFSLGIVLYELLSGKRLYACGEVTEAARRILREPPPDIDSVRQDVPPGVAQLLFELLAKDPAQRPGDAKEVSRRLENVIHDLSQIEGPLTLSDFLEHYFDERRKERRDSLAAKLELAVQNPTQVSLVESSATNRAAHRKPTRTWLIAATSLALGVLITLAVVRTMSTPNGPPADEQSVNFQTAAEATHEPASIEPLPNEAFEPTAPLRGIPRLPTSASEEDRAQDDSASDRPASASKPATEAALSASQTARKRPRRSARRIRVVRKQPTKAKSSAKSGVADKDPDRNLDRTTWTW